MIRTPVPPLMKQEKYTFVCLDIQLLHRTLKLREGEEEGEMNGDIS